jgi:hypothetical protein
MLVEQARGRGRLLAQLKRGRFPVLPSGIHPEASAGRGEQTESGFPDPSLHPSSAARGTSSAIVTAARNRRQADHFTRLA